MKQLRDSIQKENIVIRPIARPTSLVVRSSLTDAEEFSFSRLFVQIRLWWPSSS